MIRTRNAAPQLLWAATLSLIPAGAWAQTPADKSQDALPVRAVTLFSSGVSYTLREGEVSGDATVPLTFRTSQINDILKSLILLDEKGTVQPAVYGAKDPIGRTLQSFAVDVTQPLSRAELLNRLRGARVAVETSGRETLQGQIVGVETRTIPAPNASTATVEILTVLGDAGLQSVKLDEVKSIRLLDSRLDREFREALSLLASGADDKRRPVTLRFSGDGKRRVRVGYVSEAPLWKISYRLLVGGTKAQGAAPTDEKPYLQGWALVENTTDDDWNGVQLSLVSGRPVSFIQDLYQPLYLPRPVVPPDVVASPYPQVAEGAIEEKDKNAPASSLVLRSSAKALASESAPAAPAAAGGLGGGFGGAAADSSAMLYANVARNSVAAQASGEKAGELFRYNITTPVTLPRQQAAMIPVIAQDVDGTKVSLYNADTGPRFPLNAFRLKNNTTLHLKGGPVTVFDDGVYAGDARMEDIPPGDARLVTYAVDLAVEGERQNAGYSNPETSLSIRRGVFIITRRERTETEYTLKNKDNKPRTVLVEHPFNAEYKLLQPESFAERTGDRYRFEVNVPPGESQKLKVVLERPLSESVGLVDADVNMLQVYVGRGEVPEKIKAALREVLQRRHRVQDLRSQAAVNDAAIGDIEKDQDRIRKNMAALDKGATLYQRYVKQLDEQETRIQSLRSEANRLRAAAADADKDLRAYLDTLEV
jgi:hypothetical protein